MVNDYWDDSYESYRLIREDMIRFMHSMESLRSSFSGKTSPGNPVAGQLWFDVGDSSGYEGNNKALKLRKYANDGWLGVFLSHGVKNTLWQYRNDTDEGWTIDSGLSDCVIGVEGGDSSATYNSAGGTVAGSWTVDDHAHGGSSLTSTNHRHRMDSAVSRQNSNTSYDQIAMSQTCPSGRAWSNNTGQIDPYTENKAPAGDGDSEPYPSAASTYRPYAAVGTAQYCNVVYDSSSGTP